LRKAVAEKIDSVSKDEEPPKEGEVPQEGFIDGFLKSVSEKIDAVTKEEPPKEGEAPQEGFIDGFLKSVSEKIDAVTKEEEAQPVVPASPQPEGVFGGYVRKFSSGFGSFFDRAPPVVPKKFEVAIIGTSKTGKSSLTTCFVSGTPS
jgi:hypothetical protein